LRNASIHDVLVAPWSLSGDPDRIGIGTVWRAFPVHELRKELLPRQDAQTAINSHEDDTQTNRNISQQGHMVSLFIDEPAFNEPRDVTRDNHTIGKDLNDPSKHLKSNCASSDLAELIHSTLFSRHFGPHAQIRLSAPPLCRVCIRQSAISTWTVLSAVLVGFLLSARRAAA
jgi:hypothetical protein